MPDRPDQPASQTDALAEAVAEFWRQVRKSLGRRARAWPAEVREDAAADEALRALERARRTGEPPHPAAWSFAARRGAHDLRQGVFTGPGRRARPRALGVMEHEGETLAPDDWIAEAWAVSPDFDLALDLLVAPSPEETRAEAARARTRRYKAQKRAAKAEARAAASAATTEREAADVAEALARVAGCSTTALAAALGVSQPSASLWRAGARRLPLARARQILALVAEGRLP